LQAHFEEVKTVEKVKKYKSMFTFATLTFLAASFKAKLLILVSFINNLGAVAFVGGNWI